MKDAFRHHLIALLAGQRKAHGEDKRVIAESLGAAPPVSAVAARQLRAQQRFASLVDFMEKVIVFGDETLARLDKQSRSLKEANKQISQLQQEVGKFSKGPKGLSEENDRLRAEFRRLERKLAITDEKFGHLSQSNERLRKRAMLLESANARLRGVPQQTGESHAVS